MEQQERLEAIAAHLSIGNVERHIFLCADQSRPRCCGREESVEVWRHLKRRIKELELNTAPPGWQGDPDARPEPVPVGNGRVLRSKVDCLRICESGPIAVVYPDGVWYHSVTPEVIDRILTEHVIGGTPVEDHIFARGRLHVRP